MRFIAIASSGKYFSLFFKDILITFGKDPVKFMDIVNEILTSRCMCAIDWHT